METEQEMQEIYLLLRQYSTKGSSRMKNLGAYAKVLYQQRHSTCNKSDLVGLVDEYCQLFDEEINKRTLVTRRKILAKAKLR